MKLLPYSLVGFLVGFYTPNHLLQLETTPGDWTLAGTSTNVVGNGLDVPTPLPIGNILLQAGNTYGFYITTAATGYGHPTNLSITPNYTNGANQYVDANITLTAGIGLGGDNLFEDLSVQEHGTELFIIQIRHHQFQSQTEPSLLVFS